MSEKFDNEILYTEQTGSYLDSYIDAQAQLQEYGLFEAYEDFAKYFEEYYGKNVSVIEPGTFPKMFHVKGPDDIESIMPLFTALQNPERQLYQALYMKHINDLLSDSKAKLN